jgi:hypothetical protein
MQAQIFSAVPTGYGAWGSAQNPLKYEHGEHAGKAIEYVDLAVSGTNGETELRRLTLDPSINGGRPELGQAVDVICAVRQEQKIVFARDGREYLLKVDKWKAVDFLPVNGSAKS